MDVDTAVDITAEERSTVLALLERHLPGTTAWVYGSRAKWTSNPQSDLDLVVFSKPEQRRQVNDLREAFDESTLPFRVDLFVWDEVADSFGREIERDHAVLVETELQNELPEWRDAALGDVVRFLSGGTPSMREPAYWNGSIPWVSAKDMKRFRLRDTADHITDEGVANGTRLVPTGSVLVLTRGMTLLDRLPVCVTESPMAFNQDVKALRPESEIDPGFLPYLILGNKHRMLSLVDLAGHGTGRLSGEDLKSLMVRLPPRPEQRAIAHILGTLDDSIELNHRLNATLEAMAKALFDSWFVDYDPVRAKTVGRDTGLPTEIADLFPDRLVDSESGEVPAGWETGVLAEAVEILSGGTPRTSVKHYWDGDIPWYTPKDAPDPSDVFVVVTEKTITQAGVDNSSTIVLPAGTTVISARGTVGRLACLGVPMAMNQTCYGIRGADAYKSQDYFVYWLVRGKIEELRSRTHGTVFDTVTRQTFASVNVPLPPANVAKEFEFAVSPIMGRILRNLHRVGVLTALRETLLPDLVSGKLPAVAVA